MDMFTECVFSIYVTNFEVLFYRHYIYIDIFMPLFSNFIGFITLKFNVGIIVNCTLL